MRKMAKAAAEFIREVLRIVVFGDNPTDDPKEGR